MKIEKVDQLKKPTGFSKLNVLALRNESSAFNELIEIFTHLLKVVQILFNISFSEDELILSIKFYDSTNLEELDNVDGYEIYSDFLKNLKDTNYTCIAFYSRGLNDPITYIMHVLDTLDMSYQNTNERGNIKVLVREE